MATITNVGARVIALDVNEIISALHREAVAMALNKVHRDEIIPILQQCIHDQVQSIDDKNPAASP